MPAATASIRGIIRPYGWGLTARSLKAMLGAQFESTWARCPVRDPDPDRDFISALDHHPKATIRRFYQATKGKQRELLEADYGIPTPKSAPATSGKWVIRPNRHHQGIGFKTINHAPVAGTDYNPHEEYVAPCVKKRWEYRVLYMWNTPLVLMRKQTTDMDDPNGWAKPWNHAENSWFVTVPYETCRLTTHSNFFSKIQEKFGPSFLSSVPIAAFDILMDRDFNWYVSEVNFAPSLKIEDNMRRVVEHIRAHYST